MTEKGKKPGSEAAGPPDPLSATGMFLNAFAAEPDPSLDQAPESAAKGVAQPGDFTQMFHKLEPPPSPPPPQTRSSNSPPQEPGDFTRMFVAATSSGFRPPPATPDAAPFTPQSPPRMRGFSTPGVSDSASAEGSFTQLFQTPASSPAPSPLQPFTPLPTAPPQAAEAAWPQSLNPVPSEDRMAPGGLSQLFRSLSEESESPLVSHPSSPAQPPAGTPESVTMLIRRLTEDLQQAVGPTPPMPLPAKPAGSSGPGEFTRIIAGGAINPVSAPEPAVAAGNYAMPVPPTLVFPAVPVPAVAAPPTPAFAAPRAPAPPAPAFAAPQVPALAVPPAQPPKAAPSAPPQQKSKLQQMLPMLLVLNAFLVVVLILLLVFALKSR